VIGRRRSLLELLHLHDAIGRARRVVQDDAVGVRAGNDDEVQGLRAIFNQGDHRLAAPQRVAHRVDAVRARRQLGGAPAATARRVEELAGVNAFGVPVDEIREVLREDIALAPVAHHHRQRRAATERLGLGQVGHVDQRASGVARLRQRRRRHQRDGERDAQRGEPEIHVST
jgi:hypothetical protein